jgi:copper chaperone CopZ
VLHAGRQYLGSEKAAVEAALGRCQGVLAVEANPVAQTATVTYDPAATSVEDLRGWVERAGFECAGCNVPGCLCDPLHEPGTPELCHDTAGVERAEDPVGHGLGGHSGRSMEHMAIEMRNRFVVALVFTLAILAWSGAGTSLVGRLLATPFGLDRDVWQLPGVSRARYSSSSIGIVRVRSATVSRSFIAASSSTCSSRKPLHELLALVVAGVARDLEQLADPDRDLALLFERDLDRLDVVGERRARRLDPADIGHRAAIEEVVDHPHRVLALLLRLLIEERGELREGLARVVSADRNVLVRRGELSRYLRRERINKPLRHHRGAPSNCSGRPRPSLQREAVRA